MNNAATFLSRIRIGVNLDGRCITGSNGRAAIDSVKANTTGPFIRNFWRHALTNNVGGYSSGAGVPLSATDISDTLDGVAYTISVGVPVDLGLYGDSVVPGDYANNAAFAISEITSLCKAIAARNFDMTMLCIHNVNEYGNVGANSKINGYNKTFDTIIRQYLPNVPILRKGANWGYYTQAYDGTLDPPLDSNYILGCHSYENFTATSAKTMATSMQDYTAANNYQGWIYEEAGFGSSNYSNNSNETSVWEGNWGYLIPEVAKSNGRAGAWAITGGIAWRMNNSPTDLSLSATSKSITSYFSSNSFAWPALGSAPSGGGGGSGGGAPSGPTCTVAQPPVIYPGLQSFSVTATGAYTVLELAWGSAQTASPPVTGVDDWEQAVGDPVDVDLVVTNAGILGALWYRFDGGAAHQLWTATPALQATTRSVAISQIQTSYVGQSIYVTGSYTGADPTSLVYYVDAGAAPLPATIIISDPGTVQEASPGAGVTVSETFTAPGLSQVWAAVYSASGTIYGSQVAVALNALGTGSRNFAFQQSGDYVLAGDQVVSPAVTGLSNPITITDPVVSIAPTISITPPNPFQVGSVAFSGTLSAAATSAAYIWISGASVPTSTSAWVQASITGLQAVAKISITGAGAAGTLYYMVNGGGAQVGFTATPQAVSTGGGGSGGGSVSGTPVSGDVMTASFHLTARPWDAASAPASAVLSDLKSLIGYFTSVQNSAGQLVYSGGAIGSTCTATFAFGGAVLAASGDHTYLKQTLNAVDAGTLLYKNQGATSNSDGPQFCTAPLAKAAMLLMKAQLGTAGQYATWASNMAGTPKTSGDLQHNWNSYGAYGAWMMYLAGQQNGSGWCSKSQATSFIEATWNGTGADSGLAQSAQFDQTTGLYIDIGDPDSLSVEAAGRRGFLLLTLAGYDGPSASNIGKIALKGTGTSLMLMEPSGQVPAGGRTDDHIWVDIGYQSIMQSMATYVSDTTTAGRYQQAANLIFNGVRRWRHSSGSLAGSYQVTKNFYPDSQRVGYQSASDYVGYGCNDILGFAEAYSATTSTVTCAPAPVEVGGYSFYTGSTWRSAFANAGGTAVEIETVGTTGGAYFGNYWNTLGVVRIGRIGWDGRIGPSDGYNNGTVGVSFGPCWLSGSNWTRLASNPSTFKGSTTTLMASPVLTKVQIIWSGGSITFTQTVTITPDGIFSQTTQSGAGQWGMTFPLLADDSPGNSSGNTYHQTIGGGIASVTLNQSTQSFIALDSAATLSTESAILTSYGNVTPVRAVGTASTQNSFVYPASAGDPSAASVKSSFAISGNGYSNMLGWVADALYSGRTSAGGYGSAISLNNGATADATFSSVCYFILQVRDGVITAVETDRAVSATINGRSLNVSAYSPVSL